MQIRVCLPLQEARTVSLQKRVRHFFFFLDSEPIQKKNISHLQDSCVVEIKKNVEHTGAVLSKSKRLLVRPDLKNRLKLYNLFIHKFNILFHALTLPFESFLFVLDKSNFCLSVIDLISYSLYHQF